jgi:hypothetical protein
LCGEGVAGPCPYFLASWMIVDFGLGILDFGWL